MTPPPDAPLDRLIHKWRFGTSDAETPEEAELRCADELDAVLAALRVPEVPVVDLDELSRRHAQHAGTVGASAAFHTAVQEIKKLRSALAALRVPHPITLPLDPPVFVDGEPAYNIAAFVSFVLNAVRLRGHAEVTNGSVLRVAHPRANEEGNSNG